VAEFSAALRAPARSVPAMQPPAMPAALPPGPVLVQPVSAPRRSQLPALTGIRCFAALNLVFFHFSDPHSFGPLSPIVNGGYISVSFFLLLSGFILTYNYADRAQRGALTARSFWTARFSRLYPVYAFSLVLSIGMLAQEVHAHTRLDFGLGLILTPLLLQGWHPAVSTFWNTPAWTMSTEAFFYLLFPWLVTRRRPRQIRTMLVVLLAVWLSSLVLPALYMHFNPDGDLHPDRYSVGIWMRALKFMPLQHLPSFLFGMALGFLNEKIRPESRKRLAIGLLAFVALYLLLCVGDRLPYVMMHDGLLMPLFAGVILCLAGQNPIARFFGLLPFIAIGEASYCLYLLHFNLWTLLHDSHFMEKSGLIVFDPWISYLLLIVAALLTKKLIERPGRNWISRRLQPSA
jgi:peptidoglycan/LPS O-acetylase OafA/YrhL